MDKYLVIITTVLVFTQIVRVTQNAIQLHRQNNEVKRTMNWILENDISEKDFEIQREVFELLHTWLIRTMEKENEDA